MKFKALVAKKEMDFKECHLHESNRFYKDADGNDLEENILYVRMPDFVDGEDFVVLSRTAAIAVKDKKIKVADLDYNGEGGLVMPDSTKVLADSFME